MGLVALACFIAIVFVSVFLWNLASSRRLNEALAKLAAAGHPTTVADVKTTYQLPPGTNPGPLWIEAGKGLEAKDANVKKLPYLGSEGEDPPMPGEKWQQLAAAKAYLQKHAAELTTIERAAGLRAQSRYETTFEHRVSPNPSDVDARIPYVRSHRQICRVMSMACYVHAHEGDTEGVVKSITNGLRTAQSLADEPQMIGQLLAVACTEMMLARIRELISLDYTDKQLADLQDTIRDFQPKRSLLRGLQGGTVLILDGFNNPSMTGPIPRREDAAFYVEVMHPVLEAAEHVITLASEFLPAVSVDSYSNNGESLKLVTVDRTTTIYSVGFNTVDDGASKEVGTDRLPLDIVAELVLP